MAKRSLWRQTRHFEMLDAVEQLTHSRPAAFAATVKTIAAFIELNAPRRTSVFVGPGHSDGVWLSVKGAEPESVGIQVWPNMRISTNGNVRGHVWLRDYNLVDELVDDDFMQARVKLMLPIPPKRPRKPQPA